jgi:hypothetical protein
VVVEVNEELVACLGEHASCGEFEYVVFRWTSSEAWVRGVECSQCGTDRGLEGGEAGELAL